MLWTAFTIGLFGSLHCVGMCGPLMVAVPLGTGKVARVIRLLLYNFGRIITYSLLGSMMGLLGTGIFMVGLQSWLTIILGVLFILIALFSLNVQLNIWEVPFFATFYLKFKTYFGQLMKQNGIAAIVGLGALNGLLPCGLVYLALAGALTLNDWQAGMSYMFVFGLGTIPLLLTFTLIGQMAGHKWRSRLQKVYPYMLAAMGIFLIWRGMQFQLPASFNLWEAVNNAPLCH